MEIKRFYTVIAALVSIICNPAVQAQVLSGRVSNEEGCIGARFAGLGEHGINLIVKDGPADIAGLKKGDVFVSAEGIRKLSAVDGPPDTICHIVIRRQGQNIGFEINRKAVSEVWGRNRKQSLVIVHDTKPVVDLSY